MNTFFLDRLNGEPHALAFAGQSTPWPVALTDQSANPVLNEALHAHADAAQALLYPVSADLLATTGRPVDLFGFEPNPARLGAAAAASASVPGIALAQLGALLDAASLGYNPAVAKPVAVLGHSQGVLAVHMTRAIEAAGSIEAAGKTGIGIFVIDCGWPAPVRRVSLVLPHVTAKPRRCCRSKTSPVPRWMR